MAVAPAASEQQVHRVLYVLESLASKVRQGGQVSQRDLAILSSDFHELLERIGGFEDAMRVYASYGRM